MSTSAPIPLIQNGLVFCFDTNNIKSYRGQPTTNYYTNGQLASGNNVGQEGGSNPTNEVVIFPNPGDSPYCVRSTAVGGSIYTEYQLTVYNTIVANTTYCLSCWVAWTPDWDGTYSVFHMRWYDSGGSQAGASGLEQGTTIETRVVNGLTWYRRYYTFNSGSSVNGTHDWYAGYYSNNTKGYRYFTNFQLEAKSYPTPFVDGTRSNTQGLLDLTRTNTINLSAASFSSNPSTSIVFSGAQYIVNSTPTLASSQTTPFTMLAWCKPTNLTGWQTVFGTHGSYRQVGWNGTTFYFGGNGGGGNSFVSGGSGSNNNWYLLAMAYNGTTAYGYKNGDLVASGSIGSYTGGSNGVNVVGAFTSTGGEYFQGEVPIAMVYNKVLTASEILQIYNATRSRFGL